MSKKGFSYIEMLLAISIIMIMAAMAVIGMSVFYRNNVTKAATKLESAMNKAKTVSMAQGTDKGTITIFKEGNSYYYYIGPKDDDAKKNAEKTKICTGNVTLQVSAGGGGTADVTSLVYSYKPATGGFSSFPASSIIVTNGGTTKRLTFYQLTGKCKNE